MPIITEEILKVYGEAWDRALRTGLFTKEEIAALNEVRAALLHREKLIVLCNTYEAELVAVGKELDSRREIIDKLREDQCHSSST